MYKSRLIKIALLSLSFTFLQPVFGMSCNDGLTAKVLGGAWQNAHWRYGLIPFRYYNMRAVDRVIEDPDLSPLAARWKRLNDEPSANSLFMDTTYQFLVYLADLRLKNNIPLGGTPGKPKPQLAILKTMFDAYEAHVDTGPITQQVSAYLKKFVHLDGGYSGPDEQAFEFLNDHVMPAQMTLLMVLPFSRP